MTDIMTKRAFVAGLYPGPGWKAKVAKMPEPQVIAIYLREHDKAPKKNDTPDTKEGNDDIPF